MQQYHHRLSVVFFFVLGIFIARKTKKYFLTIYGLKNKKYISKEQWFKIDQEEIKRANKSSPRIKFTSHEDVFNFIDSI